MYVVINPNVTIKKYAVCLQSLPCYFSKKFCKYFVYSLHSFPYLVVVFLSYNFRQDNAEKNYVNTKQ
jgi:hypothetical protein